LPLAVEKAFSRHARGQSREVGVAADGLLMKDLIGGLLDPTHRHTIAGIPSDRLRTCQAMTDNTQEYDFRDIAERSTRYPQI
ncbi:hypothetical protein NQU49_27545, partial [Escherichia coli]|uniref:hypothetical protein n=1 Tax=Escherichia coli TaxID=562 RepID=UPI0021172E36